MRRLSLFFTLFLLLLAAAPGFAQQEAAALDWLTVDLWPDYDRESVLVLLTAGLPDDVSLPASVTVSVPADATVNAVARISDDNRMVDDIEFSQSGDALTLVTPDRRIRVEYYMPYEADGLNRSFTYDWSAPVSVGTMDVSVQQPASAAELSVTPAAAQVIEGNDGLQYHNLPTGPVPAGEPFVVDVAYTMSSAQLTAAQTSPAATTAAPATGAADGGLDLNWPLILAVAGIALIVGAGGWYFLGDRLRPARSAPRKPRPTRTTAAPSGGSKGSAAARFCHQCGEEAQPDDRFCRACGTKLKGA